MSDNRTDKRRSQEHQAHDQPREQKARGAGEAGHRQNGERKPSPIERRDWRGSGVCGDRHTD